MATVDIGTNFSNDRGHRVDDDAFLITRSLASLINFDFDYINITYVTAGDGIGEIETVTYKTGGSGGTVQGVITLGYDVNDKLSSVIRSDS